MAEIWYRSLGLKRAPFEKDVAPDALWLDESRQAALDTLLEAVSHRQHALVLGESGVGKTAVLRALRAGLSPVHHRLVYVSNVTLGRRDFYRQVCNALAIEAKATPAALFDAIQRNIHLLHQEHRVHPVLVLDEAQLMPEATLSHLHVLANFEWDSLPLLSIVLVGLTELGQRLRLGLHRSLLTRIAVKVEIQPTSPEHTIAYVRKRIRDAGADTELFTADGFCALHEITGGLLRSVDILARASLRHAAQHDTHFVDRNVVRRALHQTPLA